jgi:Cdc6-like AAA superfamily ATPase
MNGKRTSLFIKSYLKEKGEAYVQEIWNAYRKHCLRNGYRPPSRQSFGNYVWMLKKLGLIEFVREEKGLKGTVRCYYKLNPSKIKDEAWNDPVKALGLRCYGSEERS